MAKPLPQLIVFLTCPRDPKVHWRPEQGPCCPACGEKGNPA